MITKSPSNKNIFHKNIYFTNSARGVELISLYYRLVNPINKREFPISHRISKDIINFPIHQDISIDELIKIVNVTKEVHNESK